MSSQSTSLFSLARSKLHLSVGGKCDGSLHRWVLLKNSIIKSPPKGTEPQPDVNSVNCHGDAEEEDDEEDDVDEEADSFMFPDAGKLVNDDEDARLTDASEAEWLDSLLETLGDEDEDEYNRMDVHVSVLPVDDDDDSLLSPSTSPMSSSDDLVNQPAYYPPPIAVPYPVPYPPFHPPLLRSFVDSDHHFDSSLDSTFPQYADALPYHDIDDVEDLSVPDAIDDDSDDESDAPATPSLGRSYGFVDPASIPLPTERVRRHPHPHPHVYIDTDDSYFYPFELDPLPFPQDHSTTYNPVYQEC
ncbi:hypothetical protein PLICRDRAFT_40706 [Plicaturopsis crispa FD-325 SS-3]|nr:hypothetical protein PLICRDRAFT_40706 [Plicaturopsis crispa FD-325 SS-3]